MPSTFDPIRLGHLDLPNRIVMAPMTRSRAYGPGLSPAAMTATYYAQRASAGLIISEGIQPSVLGQGYPNTPGLHSDEQVRAWGQVTDAVHHNGGRIFAQLLHTGRIGHPALLSPGLRPVAPSAVRPRGKHYTGSGMSDYVTPHPLSSDEVEQTIADFVAAARNAINAGFDGIEVHGANGYLVHQFLAPNTNLRADAWGGSPEGRTRFAVELMGAISDAIGPERTALRISPGRPLNEIVEPEPAATYRHLVRRLHHLNMAYLHVIEWSGDHHLTRALRKDFGGPFVLNPHTESRPTGPEDLGLIDDNVADLLSFGALFLANPDLPRRLAAKGPFNSPDRATFYGGTEHGYIDYPSLADAQRPA